MTLLFNSITGITSETTLSGDFLNLFLRENPNLSVVGVSTQSATGYDIQISSVGLATTTKTTIDGLLNSRYRSMKTQVQITQGSFHQISDLLIIHDGTVSSIVEQASISTGDYLADFSTRIESGNTFLSVQLFSPDYAFIRVVSHKFNV